MEPLADIAAKLLAETAMQAAAPRIGDKLKAMTAAASGGASGIGDGFQKLFTELAGIPEDLKHRLQNQWQRIDSTAQSSSMAGLWDSMKAAVSGIVDKVKSSAAAISPSTTGHMGSSALSSPAVTVSVGNEKTTPAEPPQIYSPQPSHITEFLNRGSSKVASHDPLNKTVATLLERTVGGNGTEQPQAPPADRNTTSDPVAHPVQQPLAQPTSQSSTPARPWWEDYSQKNDRGEWVARTPTERQQSPSPPQVQLPPPPSNPPPPPPASPPPPPTSTSGGMGSKIFGALAAVLSGGKAATGGIAGRLGTAAMAAAPGIAARAGGLVTPGIGAAAAGLAATGPPGAIVAVVTSVALALAVLPKLLKHFGEGLVESNRELSRYDARIAASYAQYDQAAFFRKLELANATSGSAGTASSEWTKTLDSLQGPLKALATTFNVWSTGVAVISRNIPMAVQIMTGGLVKADAMARWVEQIQKDIEKMANGGNGQADWGDQFTREFGARNLPGKNKPKPPVPALGGGK